MTINKIAISFLFGSILYLSYFVDVEVNAIEGISSKINKIKKVTHEEVLKNDNVDLEGNALNIELVSNMEKPFHGWRIRKNGGIISFDFNAPQWRTLRALIRKELDAQKKQHKDPMVFTLNIVPKLASKRDDFLLITKLIDDSIRKLILKNQTVKYLAEPKLHSDILRNLRLEVVISPVDEKKKKEYKQLKKICKKEMIPQLKKQFKNMNFRFESLFNAVDIKRKKPDKNIARVVFIVYNRRNRPKISEKKLKKIFNKIRKEYPQIIFLSSFNDLDPMNPDKDYLILSFDESKSIDDQNTTSTTPDSTTVDITESTSEGVNHTATQESTSDGTSVELSTTPYLNTTETLDHTESPDGTSSTETSITLITDHAIITTSEEIDVTTTMGYSDNQTNTENSITSEYTTLSSHESTSHTDTQESSFGSTWITTSETAPSISQTNPTDSTGNEITTSSLHSSTPISLTISTENLESSTPAGMGEELASNLTQTTPAPTTQSVTPTDTPTISTSEDSTTSTQGTVFVTGDANELTHRTTESAPSISQTNPSDSTGAEITTSSLHSSTPISLTISTENLESSTPAGIGEELASNLTQTTPAPTTQSVTPTDTPTISISEFSTTSTQGTIFVTGDANELTHRTTESAPSISQTNPSDSTGAEITTSSLHSSTPISLTISTENLESSTPAGMGEELASNLTQTTPAPTTQSVTPTDTPTISISEFSTTSTQGTVFFTGDANELTHRTTESAPSISQTNPSDSTGAEITTSSLHSSTPISLTISTENLESSTPAGMGEELASNLTQTTPAPTTQSVTPTDTPTISISEFSTTSTQGTVFVTGDTNELTPKTTDTVSTEHSTETMIPSISTNKLPSVGSSTIISSEESFSTEVVKNLETTTYTPNTETKQETNSIHSVWTEKTPQMEILNSTEASKITNSDSYSSSDLEDPKLSGITESDQETYPTPAGFGGTNEGFKPTEETSTIITNSGMENILLENSNLTVIGEPGTEDVSQGTTDSSTPTDASTRSETSDGVTELPTAEQLSFTEQVKFGSAVETSNDKDVTKIDPKRNKTEENVESRLRRSGG